jgi:hypothetical protein
MASPEERETVRQSLEQHTQELRLAVQDLGIAARSWSDPSEVVRSHPAGWICGGFLVGLWLGRLGR